MPYPKNFRQQPLAEEVLSGIHAEGYWGYAHSEYPVEDWQLEIANLYTLQSYHQWVTSKLEQEEHGE